MKEKAPPARVSIIGLGLIGGSLGMAIKASRPATIDVIGYDIDPSVARKAQSKGAIDKAEEEIEKAVMGASLVIVATPLLAMRDVFREIAPYLSEGTVVTDVGSSKRAVLEWSRETLGPNVSFIGGHPMAGKETQGIKHAEAGLFKDRAYCICPALEAREEAVRAVLSLAVLVGAKPLFIDPEEHDQYAAAISHLPLLVSTAMFTLVRESQGWEEMALLASSGFRDVTRLASGEPQMSYDICVTNREAILHWLDRYQQELARFRELIASGDEKLLETFVRTKLRRDSFLANPPESRPVGHPSPVKDVPGLEEILVSLTIGRSYLDLRKGKQFLKESMQGKEHSRPEE